MSRLYKKVWIGAVLAVLLLVTSLAVGVLGIYKEAMPDIAEAQVRPAQAASPLRDAFNKTLEQVNMLPPNDAIRLVPRLFTDIFPQGIVMLPNPEERRASAAYNLWQTDVGAVKMAIDRIVVGMGATTETKQMALGMGQFLGQMLVLAQQINPMIADGTINQIAIPSTGAYTHKYQVPSPSIIEILTQTPTIDYGQILPRPRWYTGQPQEAIITPKEPIPMWGAWVITKEVKGMKLLVVKGPVPVNPCLYNIPPPWPTYPYYLWYIQLVPAEFIKSITYRNVWNFEKRTPEILIDVHQKEVREDLLLDFWWFFPPTTPYSSGQ